MPSYYMNRDLLQALCHTDLAMMDLETMSFQQLQFVLKDQCKKCVFLQYNIEIIHKVTYPMLYMIVKSVCNGLLFFLARISSM